MVTIVGEVRIVVKHLGRFMLGDQIHASLAQILVTLTTTAIKPPMRACQMKHSLRKLRVLCKEKKSQRLQQQSYEARLLLPDD